MKPMIKWAGGKRGEIPFLKFHYPAGFRRVVEPFAGGAAVAWDLDGVPAVINDVNAGLVAFYRAMQAPDSRGAVRTALGAINDRRAHLRAWVAALPASDVAAFFTDPAAWARAHHIELAQPVTLPALDARTETLLLKHGASKSRRILGFEGARGAAFGVDEHKRHVETALQSAFYEALREVYNGQIAVPDAWRVAAWWAVRALCYSGMFRFSKQGLFNVPYGGMSYNARDFGEAMADLFGPNRTLEIGRFTVESMDFEALFDVHGGFTADDFVFADPPYDSSFSQYNAESDFTRNDQERLRDALERCNARWMLVIKRTDYIQSLYAGRGHHCFLFDKTYLANFRNRHERGVQHLVVTNYPLATGPDDALRPLGSGP